MKPQRKIEGLADILARLAKSDHEFYERLRKKKENFKNTIKNKEKKLKQLMKIPDYQLSLSQLKTRHKKTKVFLHQRKELEKTHYNDLTLMTNEYFDKTRRGLREKN